MSKYCILSESKVCTDCGECNICDLNSNKQCNNCGKCLELQGYDSKAINIQEILDSDDEALEETLELEQIHENNNVDIEYLSSLNNNIKESDFELEYIEDVDGLEEILNDSSNPNSLLNEVFPGLITINKPKGN